MTDYEVIKEIDVLREFAAVLCADMLRYIDKNKIDKDNTNDLVVALYNKVWKIYNDIFSIDSLKEAYIVRGKLQIINEAIKETE